jgi:hypothetical protein
MSVLMLNCSHALAIGIYGSPSKKENQKPNPSTKTFSLFTEISQLLIERDAYYDPDADDECENNSLIQSGSKYGPHKIICYKDLQSKKDFGRVVQSNSRIIGGVSTQRARRELHDNADASVENDDGAYDLKKCDNPADDRDPINNVGEHMTSSRVVISEQP